MRENYPLELPPARDKLLFTPGPLTTSLSVKQAMLRDAGSWHSDFNAVVQEIRERLLELAGVDPKGGEYVSVLMQGSGTFGVEAILATVLPPGGKLLVLVNGAYGERIVAMCACLKIEVEVLRTIEDTPPDPDQVDRVLAKDSSITHVAIVHCETTTGILNPLEAVAEVVDRRRRSLIVDAMSSFGAIPIDLKTTRIDYLVSSANKCLEGVPGFCFVIARRAALESSAGFARSLSLDLLAQLRGFEANGQFRYTPPTHAILAFQQALKELAWEGGVRARGARYAANHQALIGGMKALGFRPYLASEVQSFIITAFWSPCDQAFTFPELYRRLSDCGMVIYPGKLTRVDTFRIGTIGRVFPPDLVQLVHAMEDALRAMGCRVPLEEEKEVVQQ